ncbi:MAG TPA: carboxypeptidase regulatory-like domain-containing protein [Blastocatellia bacterium]|nr:carboxypeptidase regulatory-like domain-containing protein [Blastocatellia bacterium]
MRTIRSLASVLITIALTVMPLFTARASAQATAGGIRGVVLDVNGAVVPSAPVIATNIATGVEYKATATGEGLYAIPRIPAGQYKITVQVQGFKKADYQNVEVSVGRDVVVDVTLEPGAVSESVTVTGTTEVLIEKDTAQISARFRGRAITDLPINLGGGGLDRIALAMPGITSGIGANVNANGTQISANGNRTRANNFTIDGVDNNDLSIGGPNYFVRNKDLVQEYQVITNNFSAEYGRNAGAIINIATKQGGNGFHGAVTWYHQDNKIFNTLTNIERRRGDKNPTPNLINIFDYGVGGRIIKDKLFFFTAAEIRRNPGLFDVSTTSYAPTSAGIALLKSSFPGNNAIQYYANNSAFAIGSPQVRSDVAQTTITLNGISIPMAAVRRVQPQPDNRKEFNQRVDYNMTDKNRFWGRWFYQNTPGINFLLGVDGFSGNQPSKSVQLGGGWTNNTTSRSVNEFRFNYSKLDVLFGGGCEAATPGCIPVPTDIDKGLTNLTFNFTAANGGTVLGVGPATNLPQGRIVESFQFTDNYDMTIGRHQMKVGADIRRLRNQAPFLPFVNGQFIYSTVSGQPPTVQLANNAAGSVNVALGPAALRYTEWDKFFYVQDDWRIKPNFTLNLGIRYENTGQPINLLNESSSERESDNAQAFWRQNLPLEARVIPKIPTDKNNWAPRFGFVYTPQFKSGLLNKLFGDDDTIIRGGYGISYDAAFYNLLLNISTSSPFVFSTTVNNFAVPDPIPTGDKVRAAAVAAGAIKFNTFDPRFFNRTVVNTDFRSPYIEQWSFGLQRQFSKNYVLEARYVGNHQVALFQTVNNNPFMGNLINGFTRPYRDPGGTTNKTLSFRGFPGLFPGVTPLVCTDNPATADNEGVCNGRLFPTGVARNRINGAQALYHGLQTRLEGRLRNWLTYGASYTWSHTIDNSSEVFQFNGGNGNVVAQNPLDVTRGERSHSGFDVRNVFNAFWVWDIPVMRSQKGVLGHLLGGWQLNGVLGVRNAVRWNPLQQSTTRNPYEDNAFQNFTASGIGQMRPFSGSPNAPLSTVGITDVDACIFYAKCGASGGVPIFIPSSTGFYLLNDLNKATPVFTAVKPGDVRFIVNGPGAAQVFGTPFGNIARNLLTGDRVENLDFSVFKTTRVTERVSVQYRLNMFNALNHPNFGIPNSIRLDQAGTTFNNYQENSGGRRSLEMALRIMF